MRKQVTEIHQSEKGYEASLKALGTTVRGSNGENLEQ